MAGDKRAERTDFIRHDSAKLPQHCHPVGLSTRYAAASFRSYACLSADGVFEAVSLVITCGVNWF